MTQSPLQKKIIQILPPLSKSLLSQLSIISLGVMILFILLGFCSWLDNVSFTPIISWKEILMIIFFFIFFVEVSFIVSSLSAFTFWICAKQLRGVGTYFQTCNALLWTIVYTILPFSLLSVFVKSVQKTNMYNIACIIAFLGMVVSMIWGFVALVQKFSKIHRVSRGRAFCIWLAGINLQAPIVLLILFLINTYKRTSFIILITIFVQVLISLAFVWIGLKLYKKIKKHEPFVLN